MEKIFRAIRPQGLWPRGRLDISWSDLFYALQAPYLSGVTPHRVWPTKTPHLPIHSVRTAWDALLSVKNWPVGSEIIISEANIPDMVHIIRLHGLIPVTARLNPDTLSVDAAEVQSLITPRTKAILVSPLFGSHMDLSELSSIAKKNNLLLIEDNAQGYRGTDYTGSPAADVTLFSFGLIKTRTALTGAVVFARDLKLLAAIDKHTQQYPRIPTAKFYQKLARAYLLQLLSQRHLFAAFWHILEARGIDPDIWLSQATRGMIGNDLLLALRRQPHPATLKLLRHRLSNDRQFSHERKVLIARGQHATKVLKGALGKQVTDSVFWALPVQVSNREQLVIEAREAGFDLSFRASSLISHSDEPTLFSSTLDDVVFLPISAGIPDNEWNRLLEIVREFDIN